MHFEFYVTILINYRHVFKIAIILQFKHDNNYFLEDNFIDDCFGLYFPDPSLLETISLSL